MDKTWKVNDSYSVNGKLMLPGTEFAAVGERGARFRFVSHVMTEDGAEWINCVGGVKGVSMWRSFRPSKILRITKLNPVQASVKSF